jgi:hypothetical protein
MWKDIKLKEYQNYNKVLNKYSGSTILSAEDESFKLIEIISSLSNLSVEYLENLSIVSFNKILEKFEFLKELPKTDLKSSYIINNVHYIIDYDINNINTLQYLNIIYLKNDNDILNNLHKICAIFLKPATFKKNFLGKECWEGKNYGTYNVKEVENELLEHMNVEDAYSLMIFFCLLFKNLQTVYTKKIKKDMKILKKKKILKR